MGKILLEIDNGLTSDPTRDRIANTYVGQAHIAGTGPKGKTCRECELWGKDKPMKHDRFGHRADCLRPGELKEGQCHKVWPNKAFQLFPHDALACSFFEENQYAPVAVKRKAK